MLSSTDHSSGQNTSSLLVASCYHFTPRMAPAIPGPAAASARLACDCPHTIAPAQMLRNRALVQLHASCKLRGCNSVTLRGPMFVQMLRNGALIKMDAGCELHGYNSDVTRCWPVSGSFSPQQRDLYEAVLEVNRHACCTLAILGLSSVLVCPLSALASTLLELQTQLTHLQPKRKATGLCRQAVSKSLWACLIQAVAAATLQQQ